MEAWTERGKKLYRSKSRYSTLAIKKEQNEGRSQMSLFVLKIHRPEASGYGI